MRAKSNADRARGFTLIEVLAALVIVALGMMGVIEAVTQSARNGTYLREKTLAHWVAMNVITERRLSQTAPEIGETKDDVEFAGTHWKWTLRVSKTQVPTMRRLDVLVREADAPEDSSLVQVSGFYGTAIAPASGNSLTWRNAGNGGQNGGQAQNQPSTTPGVKPPGRHDSSQEE